MSKRWAYRDHLQSAVVGGIVKMQCGPGESLHQGKGLVGISRPTPTTVAQAKNNKGANERKEYRTSKTSNKTRDDSAFCLGSLGEGKQRDGSPDAWQSPSSSFPAKTGQYPRLAQSLCCLHMQHADLLLVQRENKPKSQVEESEKQKANGKKKSGGAINPQIGKAGRHFHKTYSVG